jgi:hypothetical protein
MNIIPKIVKGLDPVADAFDGTVTSDVFSMKNHKLAVGIIYKGAGATGTSTITVLACDDTTPTTTEAIPFKYQAITSGDTPGAITAATTSGFTTTAGSSQRYLIYIDASDLADSGYGYCQIQAVEDANDPVLGGIDILLFEGKEQGEIPVTAIV